MGASVSQTTVSDTTATGINPAIAAPNSPLVLLEQAVDDLQ